MRKRLLITLIAVLLIAFSLQLRLVTPVFAGTVEEVKQSLYTASAQINFATLDYSREVKPSIIQDKLIPEIFYDSVQALHPSSTLFRTQISREVTLNLTGPNQVELTHPIIFSGYLKDFSTGAGIPNKTITFSTAGVYLGQTHTNDEGIFSITINKDLDAGEYLAIASFKGAHQLAPAFDAVLFQIMPATVHVQTVPAIAGITFQMDNRQFISGPDGSATINIDHAGKYRLQVLLDQYNDPSQQVEFGRWSVESYQPFREVEVPDNDIIQVGLNVYHRVSLKFVDLDGFQVDPARISSISIRSVQGDVFTLQPDDTPWLPASRTARRQSGLEQTDLLYSINNVTIDGSNVVNSAQQRFYARSDSTWTITLLLYSLQVTARDGLFASPVGRSVDVVFPNGQIKNYAIDNSGSLQIHTLARGIYHINLIGVKGLGTTTPVALSRNQVVKLNIVTHLDIAVIGFVSIVFASGLVLYGRPRILTSILRRKHKPSSRLGWTPKHET